MLGGLAGGAVFGMLMGMLPMLASMVGSSSALVGFWLHLIISIMIGSGLTVLFGNHLVGSRTAGDDAPDAGDAPLRPGHDQRVLFDGAPDLRGYSEADGRAYPHEPSVSNCVKPAETR
ncbi:hypothetical protein [Cryobacterium cheniae]|uniref:hypothetical protein n=1 Tax=Cryobacterium cheniae TaxID=1259262 RepID=UPI001F54505B|nr:hypothetical protein [Cryobacterium cheniae]